MFIIYLTKFVIHWKLHLPSPKVIMLTETNICSVWNQFFFFKENVRYPVWICREPISLILGTRFEILGTRIGSLKSLKKPWWNCLRGNTDCQQFENDKKNVDVAPPGKTSADAYEWSCFLAFVTFALSLITNCLFLSVLLISVAK